MSATVCFAVSQYKKNGVMMDIVYEVGVVIINRQCMQEGLQ